MKGEMMMINITGHIYFDLNRTMNITGGERGIANVTVVLQEINTKMRLGVYTDNLGRYTFNNVPEGEYRIVEAYGEPAVNSPGMFNEEAEVGLIPTATVPPISYAPNPPDGATNLDCVTPNTIYVTASTENIVVQDILNGPVAYIPISILMDKCAEISNENQLTAADFGTMGTFIPATNANTGADPDPYPGLAPDFKYVLPDPLIHVPDDGEYTIQNLMNNSKNNEIGSWWRIADHSLGNEQGRMMMVNGYQPGSIFAIDEVSVKPHTNYLFSAWILNMFKVPGYASPTLGVIILDESGKTLYDQRLGQLIPVNENYPEWKQIGTVINSQENTHLTVEFLSEGPAAWGNDYAIDDISFSEISLPLFKPAKSVDKPQAYIGDTVTYTVTIENTCTQALTDVFFSDNIPEGLVFLTGSVKINGIEEPLANLVQGFPLPDIANGEKVEVSFSAEVISIPDINPTINTAEINYAYTPIEGGIPDSFTAQSNEVPLLIRLSDCEEGSCVNAHCKLYDVSVPITITPFAMPERPEITCEGEMVSTPGHIPCESEIKSFEFTLTQRIKIDIPVKFGAEVCFDDVCAEDRGMCDDITAASINQN